MIRGNELFMDVIEDPLREAEEIQVNNPWLTYGEPIHRLRYVDT
jgi:hypothetical protein